MDLEIDKAPHNHKLVSGIIFMDFPEWVLIEVFIRLRLPVKLIFRLKLVCKHWFSVISDPGFVRSLISRAPQFQPFQPLQPQDLVSRGICDSRPSGSLRFQNIENIYPSELQSPTYVLLHLASNQQWNHGDFTICGSDNGLVLYRYIPPSAGCIYITMYNICNPITGHWITVPPLIGNFHFLNFHVGFLSEVEGGVLNRYRMVSLDCSNGRGDIPRFWVFYSESCEWKSFNVNSNVKIKNSGRRPFTLHGNLHWLLDQNGVLSYNPDKSPNDLRIIPSPRYRDQEYNQVKDIVRSLCGVCDGKLRYIQVSPSNGSPFTSSLVGIWKLDDYGSGDWVLQHRITHIDGIDNAHYLQHCLLSFDPYNSAIVYVGSSDSIFTFNIMTNRLEAHGKPCTRCDLNNIGLIFMIPSWPTSIPASFNRRLLD